MDGSRIEVCPRRGEIKDRLEHYKNLAPQADVEAGTEEVGAVRQVQVQIHFGVDGSVGGELNFPFASHDRHRTFETGRPPSSKQLLRICAGARCSRYREFDIQPTVGAARRAVFTPPVVWVLAVYTSFSPFAGAGAFASSLIVRSFSAEVFAWLISWSGNLGSDCSLAASCPRARSDLQDARACSPQCGELREDLDTLMRFSHPFYLRRPVGGRSADRGCRQKPAWTLRCDADLDRLSTRTSPG